MTQTPNQLIFPEGFLWGSATSAHQVEGGNSNDWTEWEKKTANSTKQSAKLKEWPDFILKNYPDPLQEENYISGRACDHYNRYEEDLDLAKNLGHNAHRLSIEWSRIEPEEGKFSEKEILHYRKILYSLKGRGLKTMITMHHFTNPIWFAGRGGFANKKSVFYFCRYAERIFNEYKDLVDFWATFNEPWTLIGFGYLSSLWPPQKKNPILAIKVLKNIISAHKKTFNAMHSIDEKARCGLVNVHNFFEPFNRRSVFDRIIVNFSRYAFNDFILNKIKNHLDFIGLNYYMHLKLKFPDSILKPLDLTQAGGQEITDRGWEIYPEGIYHALLDLKKYQKPVYITENGLADAKDEKRAKFIVEHLKQVHRAIQDGVDARGYFYWSLLDNFEWEEGFWPRFGLVEIDYKTMERKPRPSAYEYAKICRENKLVI